MPKKTRSVSVPVPGMARHVAKRRWNAADARKALVAHQGSGLSLTAFARREGLSLTRLAWWRTQLREKTRAPEPAVRWLPVAIRGSGPPSPPASAPASSVEIVVRGGRVIRIGEGFDAGMLARLVQTLEQLGC